MLFRGYQNLFVARVSLGMPKFKGFRDLRKDQPFDWL
jgi:hypothetical protein